ncbi:MAG: hypothetical protein ABZF75_01140, partial [Columbia Basin potato purple top phytoplasma]
MFKKLVQTKKRDFQKMNKYLYGLTEIIKFLIQQSYFKIRLFHQKTNYNLGNQTLYLNYSDLYEIMILLKQ